MQQEVTQEQPEAAPTPALPAHLKPEWFDEGAPIPSFLVSDPNWMDNAALQDETVYVRMPDGTTQQTMYPIHLGLWLQSGGKITASPKED